MHNGFISPREMRWFSYWSVILIQSIAHMWVIFHTVPVIITAKITSCFSANSLLFLSFTSCPYIWKSVCQFFPPGHLFISSFLTAQCENCFFCENGGSWKCFCQSEENMLTPVYMPNWEPMQQRKEIKAVRSVSYRKVLLLFFSLYLFNFLFKSDYLNRAKLVCTYL